MQTIYQSFESPFIETFYQPFAIELKNTKPAVYQVLQYAYYLFSILAPILEMAVIALALKISVVNLSLTALFCVLATSMVLARLVAVLPVTIVMRILQSYSQKSECVSFTYILIAQWFGVNDWSHDFTQKRRGTGHIYELFFFDSIATIDSYAVLIAAVVFLQAYIVQR